MAEILTTSFADVKLTSQPYNHKIDGNLERMFLIAKFIPSSLDNPREIGRILARRALELGATHLFDVNWISVRREDNYSDNGKVICGFAYRSTP